MTEKGKKQVKKILRPQKYAALLLFVIVSALFLYSVAAESAQSYSTEKADFIVKFKGMSSAYRVIGLFVLPGETITLEAESAVSQEPFHISPSAGTVKQIDPQSWQWAAPQESGHYPIKITQNKNDDLITINAFVMIPYSRLNGEYLNNYRIGQYPDIPLRNLPIYRPPKGFVEITKENEDVLVSPHFRIKSFLCKQQASYPKYIVLQEKLLLKLELTLEKVNENGYPCSTFTIMSGYRTPFYNKAIGNVKYSRHLWGGAADIFIDENPKDDMMDDLNQDGMINYKDAAVLYSIIDKMYGNHWYEPFVGGLGRYKKTSAHGPFVHLDVRGFHARWGY